MVNVDSSVYYKRTSAVSGTRVIRILGGIGLFVGNTRQAPVGTVLSNDSLGADSGILLNELNLRNSLILTLILRLVKKDNSH